MRAAEVLLAGLAAGWVAAIGVALVLRATRRCAPRGRYLFILGALALTIAVPMARMGLPPESRVERVRRAASMLFPGAAGEPGELRGRLPGPPAVTPFGSVWTRVREVVASPRVARFVLGVWAAGALLLLARELAAHRLLRVRSRGWRPAPRTGRPLLPGLPDGRVYLSLHDGPLAVGLLRPRVVLPAWLPPQAVPAVLRHEAEHVRWHDPLANALVGVACALLWPWLHLRYLGALARIEQEVAADRAGAGPADAGGAAHYVDTLLDVARRTPPRGHMLPFPAHAAGDLEERVRRLLAGGEARNRGLLLLGPAALLVWAGGAFAALPDPGVPRAATEMERRATGPSLAVPGSPRTALRFVNLPGTPMRVLEASARPEAGGITDPLIRLRNGSPSVVSEFALAFVVNGRATAVLRDTSDVAAGAEYVVHLPGDGRINAAAGALTVAVIEARGAGAGSWGTPSPPGVLPRLPAVQSAATHP